MFYVSESVELPRRSQQRGPSSNYCRGMITVSITWITPLLAAMSVFTTLALSIITLPPDVMIFTSDPWTVLAFVQLHDLRRGDLAGDDVVGEDRAQLVAGSPA